MTRLAFCLLLTAAATAVAALTDAERLKIIQDFQYQFGVLYNDGTVEDLVAKTYHKDAVLTINKYNIVARGHREIIQTVKSTRFGRITFITTDNHYGEEILTAQGTFAYLLQNGQTAPFGFTQRLINDQGQWKLSSFEQFHLNN